MHSSTSLMQLLLVHCSILGCQAVLSISNDALPASYHKKNDALPASHHNIM